MTVYALHVVRIVRFALNAQRSLTIVVHRISIITVCARVCSAVKDEKV